MSPTAPLRIPPPAWQPVPNATGPLSWNRYRSTQSAAALSLWSQLERRLQARTITNSSLWTDCWIRHYGIHTPFEILAAHSAGEVRGVVLITEGQGRSVGPFPVRTRHLGTAGERQQEGPFVEYNRLLVEPGYESPFVDGLIEYLKSDAGWDQLRLDGFHETDLRPLRDRLPGMEVHRRPARYCNIERIRQQAGGDILSQLGKSTRANIRRRLRDYGELGVTWAESLEVADDIFAELVELHQKRWQAVGQPGAFACSRFRRFQHDVMLRGVDAGRVVLFRARHRGETVGCLMLLVDGDRLLDYLSGFASFEEKPSPGLITHYLCMQEALKRGLSAYDFLVGDKRHKENLSTDTAWLCWANWSRPTLKMQTINLLRGLKRRWSRRRCARPGEASDLVEQHRRQ